MKISAGSSFSAMRIVQLVFMQRHHLQGAVQVLLLLISLAALLGALVMYAVENGTKESAGAFFSSVMLFSF